MKFLMTTVMLLLLASCEQASPTAPFTPTPPAPPANNVATDVVAWVYGSGVCLPGATVEVLDGIRAGIKGTQVDCSPLWDGGGVFFSLPSGVTVRLRAAKEGYVSQELTIVPGQITAGIDFVLTRL